LTLHALKAKALMSHSCIPVTNAKNPTGCN